MNSPEGRTLAASLKTVVDVAYVLAWGAATVLALGAAIYALAAARGGSFDFVIGGASAGPNSWQAVAPAILSGLMYASAAIVILGRLRAVFATVSIGDPFAPANAPRLEAIGWALAALEIGRYLVQFLTMWIIAQHGQPAGGLLEPLFRPSVSTWFAVFVVFVLAQIFREGSRLREDRELTI